MDTLRRLSRRRWLKGKRESLALVIVFGAIGFLVPTVFAYINGFPVPHVHDEFSYLLAADTYAKGRLSNPAPEQWENFEAPHILVRPTYASKYPPMQGLFLASGELLFGDPSFGIWISCGFAAAALFWMLVSWTGRRWAMIGAGLFILFLGVNHYWAQSFWGGMVASGGGALFFGGWRRLFRSVTVSSAILMTLGGIILVNSRSFEGTVMMLPAMLVLFVWTLRDEKTRFVQRLSKVILPGFILTAMAIGFMGYLNYRVTGSALRFPYTEHQAQYFSTPLFIFQSPSQSELGGNPRLKDLYEFLNCSGPIRNLENLGLPRVVYLYPVYAFVYLSFFLPISFLGPPIALFFFVAAILLCRNRWTAMMLITIAFTELCMSFATYWENSHYAASLTPCFFLVAIQGFRYFWGSARKKQILTFCLLGALSLFSAGFQWMSYVLSDYPEQSLLNVSVDLNRQNKLRIPERATYLKPVIEKAVAESGDNYLAIVSYDKSYSRHDEMVFNSADLESQILIWANDLGSEKNGALLNHFKDRKILSVKIAGSYLVINPFTKQ